MRAAPSNLPDRVAHISGHLPFQRSRSRPRPPCAAARSAPSPRRGGQSRRHTASEADAHDLRHRHLGVGADDTDAMDVTMRHLHAPDLKTRCVGGSTACRMSPPRSTAATSTPRRSGPRRHAHQKVNIFWGRSRLDCCLMQSLFDLALFVNITSPLQHYVKLDVQL